MVFYSRGRGRGATRGRGRGVGEVAFEPRSSHSQGSNARDSHHDQTESINLDKLMFNGPPAESLRITVGNDQFRDRGDNLSSGRLGPPRDRESYERDRPQSSSRDEDIYRREAEVYAHAERDRLDRSRDFDRRGSYDRDPYSRPEERDYGDRRGIGASMYDKPAQSYSSLPTSKAPLFPAASRSPPRSYKDETPATSLSQSSGGGSRPLKSILKKKSDPVEEQKPEKPAGLPGIASYMDDIEDEDKFLYGGDDERRHSDQGSREAGQYGHQTRGVPIEDMRVTNIRSAAQSWKPSAPPERTVSGVVAEFVSAQREYASSTIIQQQPMYNQPDLYQSQPAQASVNTNDGGGNDLWSMLAKSVQTVQQQQQIPQSLPVSFPQSFNVPPAQPAFPVQENPVQAVSHDPTIENILKSIGFDFEMSKRMQEKAKQGSGEVTVPTVKPGEPEFINQSASFIGSQFSHEEMVSQLRPSHDLEPVTPEREPQRRDDERRQDSYSERSRREGSEASRGRMRSPPRGQSPEQLQRGCSPVSAEGSPSPPPPMFNLPPITIKRRSVLDRRSPDWDKKKSKSRSPTRESDRNRKRSSKSPSWNRSISSYGRRSSRSPGRKRTPSLPRNRSRTRSPPERAASPVIKRTFNLEGLSPAIRRKFSPGARQRSSSPALRNVSPEGKRRRSTSPDRWSPGNRRRSKSPGYRRSRSPGRRRSRSPVSRRSRSPRHYSPRRRSISPRGRKRGHSRSRSRERKMRRSLSREKRRRSSSRDRSRRRSRSRGRERGRDSRSPRSKRSVSLSSDSDVDGPANKMYFSSPLRLSSHQRREIPRFYDNPPPHSQGPPPDFSAPPPPMYATDPSGYPVGPPPGMFSMPPGAPPFGMPPPGMGPPPMMGPPPGYPYAIPGPPGMYGMPGPPMGPPSNVPMNPEDGPPGTMDMPLNLPPRPNLQAVEPELSRRETESPKEREKKTERRHSRSRSREKDRSVTVRSREKSSSSHRTVLPPRPKAEDIEIVASTKSNERVVVIGGKATKMSSSSKSPKEEKREKKVDTEKEKSKIMKEKESMVAKIKALEMEFNNLKKQEFDLQSRNVQDGKPDPILAENKKLLEEIKKEIVKLTKRKKDFEVKHAELLKQEISTKREIKISAKKTPAKDDKSKTGEKKEEFKVEKGKLMRHHFYDSGDHWCKPCNSVHSNIQDFMHHLASYKHKQTLPSDFRPWMDGYKANDGMIINKKGTRIALPGIEFLMPVTAYYCQLCKVFLGDVSMGADHFKCESHYINYKKYLSDNPIYEKKYKEEREQSVKNIKAEMKVELAKNEAKAKEQRKRSDSDKDARVRENEKKWDKTVEDLQDENTGSIKPESTKSQIKLNLKDQKSETGEKGFGKFTWNKDKKQNEDTKNGEKTPDADQDKDKGKINFNILTSGKNIIGKSGAQKRNPLLPPWQPVGKKTETPGKLGETTSLDSFLTTNSGEGKIPVITEKKKISAKEILEAFEGKYKEKEEAAKEEAAREEAAKEADETPSDDKKLEEKMEVSEEKQTNIDADETKTDENEAKIETSEEENQTENSKEVLVDQPKSGKETKEENKTESLAEVVVEQPKSEQETKEENRNESANEVLVVRQKSEKEIKEENEKRMMGIDPDLEIPLAKKKPPPPRSQNVPLPGHKPSATVGEKELHKVFHADTTDESEKPKTDIVDLKAIPIPDSTDQSEKSKTDTVDLKSIPFPVSTESKKPKTDIEDLTSIPFPDSTDEAEKPKTDISTDQSEIPKSDIVDLKSIPFPDFELPDDIFAPDSPGVKEESKTASVSKTEEDFSVKSDTCETETNAGENTNVVKVELEFDSNVNKKTTLETETSVAVTGSENMMEVSSACQEVKPKETSSEKNGLEPMVVEIELGTGESEKEIMVNVESSDNVSEMVTNGKEKQTEEIVAVRKSKSRSRETTPKSVPDDEDKEDEYGGETEEEEEEPVLVQKGRGRGRGKRGGRGRGRGARGRGKSQKSSRSLRSSKAVEVSVEIGDSETVKNNTDNVDSDENNKGLEVKSSVQIGKPTGSKKKTTSPRVRKTSVKSDRAKQDLKDISDDDDNLSLGSFGSVEMGSDFEIVDDIEDMDVLDETL